MIKKILLRLYLGTAFLIGIFVSGDLYQKTINSGGYFMYLALLSIVVTLTLGAAALFTISWRQPERLEKGIEVLISRDWFGKLVAIFALLAVECGQDYLFLQANLGPGLYVRYRTLLLDKFSLLFGVFLMSVLSLIVLIFLRCQQGPLHLDAGLRFRKLAVPFSIIVVCWGGIQWAGGGFQNSLAYQGFFKPMNAPLIGIQAGLILGFVLLMVRVKKWLEKKVPGLNAVLSHDALIVFLLWGAAFLIWMRVPVDPNYFFDSPRPPNFEIYLNSDSLNYEIEAQRWLAGEGFSMFAEHPLYSFFLGILHRLGGDNLFDILWMQVAVLCFIPVLIYKLAVSLQDRVTGLFAALLYVTRQRNSLLVMETITVSNVKSVMTESLTVLSLVLFIYLSAKWLQNPKGRTPYLLAAGGALGLATLIRVESLVIMPIFILLALFRFQKRGMEWILGMLPFLIGVIMMVSPWILRNWHRTGLVFIDKQYKVQMVIDSVQDRLIPRVERIMKPGQEPLEGEGFPPAERQRGSLDSVPNHLANNFLQLLLYLPSNHQPLLSFRSLVDIPPMQKGRLGSEYGYFSERYVWRYVKSLPYWWMNWDNKLAVRSVFPLLVTSFLVSLGLIAGFEKDPSLTWLLILSGIGVITIHSLFKNSGGRFILSADWIPLLFYGVGMMKCIQLVSGERRKAFAEEEISEVSDPAGEGRDKTRLWVFGSLITLIGLSLPLSEALIPPAYDRERMENALERVLDPEAGLIPEEDRGRWEEGLEKGAQLRYGKTIYPRFYSAGERMPDDRGGEIPDYSYPRVEFYLVGFHPTWVTIPRDDPPQTLPHGSEVIVLGAMEPEKEVDSQPVHGPYFKARQVLVLGREDGLASATLLFCQGSECE